MGCRDLPLVLPHSPSPEEEARLGLLFQRYVLTQYLPMYELFIAGNDEAQRELYSRPSAEPIGFAFRDRLIQLCHGITHTGFLSMATAHIPGAVEAWMESVNDNTRWPVRAADWRELHFFEFTPSTGRLLSQTTDVSVSFLPDGYNFFAYGIV